MPGYLTTHVLDTAKGQPAAGLVVTLFRLTPDRTRIASLTTNADGRTDAPILPPDAFKIGAYELVFSCGEYLKSTGQNDGELMFLDEIPIRFAMNDPEAHYHVPLLLSPFGYSTYRGS